MNIIIKLKLIFYRTKLEHNELFLQVSCNFLWLNSEDVESHCFWEWSALSNSDNVSWVNSETWGAVGLKTCVSLLKSLELSYVVKIVSSNNDSSSHFWGDYESLVDLSSDGWLSSEWALIVNIVSLNSFLWSLES